MKIRGNYLFMYIVQFFAGIITYFACLRYDIYGVLIGFGFFFVALMAVQIKHQTDERELALSHQANSYEAILVAVIMSVVYLYFPELNWFYVFAASISIARGLIGTLLFAFF